MYRPSHALILTSLIILLSLHSSLSAQGSSKYSLAVLNLAGQTDSFDYTDVKLISGELTREISSTGMFFTMSQVRMEEGLLSQGLDPDRGCPDVNCALRLGTALGVQLVVYGEIRQSGSANTLDVHMVHVASGQTVKSQERTFEGGFDAVLEQMPQFARDLMGIAGSHSETSLYNNSGGKNESYRPTAPTREAASPAPRPQYYEKSGGSKWLYIGIGALVAGGVGAGVLLLTGDDDSASGPGGSSGRLGGPPSFP